MLSAAREMYGRHAVTPPRWPPAESVAHGIPVARLVLNRPGSPKGTKPGGRLGSLLDRPELELGQVVGNLEPRRLGTNPEVGERTAVRVVVEDAEAHTHRVGIRD